MPAMHRRALTLVELLLVIGIIAVLIGLLVPSLASARRTARSVACAANLRSLITAITQYGGSNDDAIIPSYNMRGISGGMSSPLDGWGPILDKSLYVLGSQEIPDNVFCCPSTLNVAGMAATQTGTNPDNPQGYMDWPAVITGSAVFATPIPQWNFERVIRVGYWINGDNPFGRPQTFIPNVHFTGSVGYGPDPAGKTMQCGYFSRIRWPSRLIALADGLYSGQQESTRPGNLNSRIGYRHGDRRPRANAAFADGHVSGIAGAVFPRKYGEGNVPLDQVRAENLGERPTLYTNPERDLALP